MKKLLLLILINSIIYANDEDHTDHIETSKIDLNFETLNFTHSKKKSDGKRSSIKFDYQSKKHHYQLFYEKTDTSTKKIVPKDLEVDKYALVYEYKLNQLQRLSFSYMQINDNLMSETDDGRIYGVGYSFCKANFTQYFSDYRHFDVYESDLSYRVKKSYNDLKLMGVIEGKYIHLKDKNSNNFSKKAKSDYFTLGIKAHMHYLGYHFGIGTYQGTRIFSVMRDAFIAQHHAMEFKESYMFGVGHKVGSTMVHLRYKHSKAKEIVSNNDNVKVDALSLNISYKF